MRSDSAILMAADPHIDDLQLIDKVLDGEKDIYEVIIRRYNERLFKIARSIIKDEDEAEDVMQEAYVRAYEHLDQFKGKAKFSTWLTKILINEAFQRKRKSKRFSDLPSMEGLELQDQDTPRKVEIKEQKIIKKNVKELLETSIDSLPEKYRTVFVMREIENLSVSETAQCLSITKENVKVRLHRAKKHLRTLIQNSMSNFQVYEFLDPRCNRVASKVMQQIESRTLDS